MSAGRIGTRTSTTSRRAVCFTSKVSAIHNLRPQHLSSDQDRRRGAGHRWMPKDWDEWVGVIEKTREIEQQVKETQTQIDKAVKNESYITAACLKKQKDDLLKEHPDTVKAARKELQVLIEQERFEEASKIRDTARTGLVGWWVGICKGVDDPYGHILKVEPEFSSYSGHGYYAQELVQAYGKELKLNPFVSQLQGPTIFEEANELDSLEEDCKGEKLFELFIKKSREQEYKEQLITYSLLAKDRDMENILETTQMIDSDSEVSSEFLEAFSNTPEDEFGIIQEKDIFRRADVDEEIGQPELPTMSVSISDNMDEQFDAIEEVLRDAEMIYKPAEMTIIDRDRFNVVWHHPRIEFQEKDIPAISEGKEGNAYSELMTTLKSLIKKANSIDIPFAATEEEKQPDDETSETLSVEYRRLHIDRMFKTDLFSGLYYGNFGSGIELLHLERCVLADEDRDGLEEYVTARKLTGDPNVPAGEYLFKARINSKVKLSTDSQYPEELGVLNRYAGKGMTAKENFEDPKWVDGELLHLSTHSRFGLGAPLAFVWSAPEERKVVILLQKLELPEIS